MESESVVTTIRLNKVVSDLVREQANALNLSVSKYIASLVIYLKRSGMRFAVDELDKSLVRIDDN